MGKFSRVRKVKKARAGVSIPVFIGLILFAMHLRYYLFLCGWLGLCAWAQAQHRAPLIVFVTGDHEYSSEATMPLLAAELEKNYGFRTKVLKAHPDQNAERNIPGMEALDEADLAVFFLRWRQLPAEQLAPIERYLKSGKPVMGFRTTTHAFNYPAGHELARWNAFGEFALNAPPGWGGKAQHTHYGHNSSTDVTIVPEAARNPILTGVAPAFHVRSWLYRVRPDYPTAGSTPLLMGKAVNPDKAAVENPVAWTGTNASGGRVFMTTLGHPEDFGQEPVQRLVINAMHWSLGRPVPKKWKGPLAINVPYRGM
jgi:type 1 glutamine amidotransferase